MSLDIDDLRNLFDKHSDEFYEFNKIKNKLSERSDLHAILLLDQLLPGSNRIISAAEHDLVYLGIDVEEFCKVATEDHLIELIRCGLLYQQDSFGFFT